MKTFYYAVPIVVGLVCSCATQKAHSEAELEEAREEFQNTIQQADLEKLLYTYASDEMEGRRTSEPGQKKAVAFLADFYQNHKIKPPKALKKSYFQVVPMSYINSKSELVDNDSENVLAFIKGKELAEEVVVVSAHLDHLGMKGNEVYNGADDDGSGTVAVLEIAQAMQQAVKAGYRPKRSILFLHVTSEELGLWGSSYYADHPVIPMKNTVADLNIDMIGRVDEKHENNPNYVYPIGSDMLSDDLHEILLETNAKTQNLELDFTFNSTTDPNRFYYRSDHYNFAKNEVPVIFFFNGVHADYHETSDTPDKINYPMLTKRTKLIFNILWELVNREERIQLKAKE